MRIPRGHNFAVAGLMTLALGGVFGPHLAILGYKLAGARAPAALVFVCPLHHGSGGTAAPATKPS